MLFGLFLTLGLLCSARLRSYQTAIAQRPALSGFSFHFSRSLFRLGNWVRGARRCPRLVLFALAEFYPHSRPAFAEKKSAPAEEPPSPEVSDAR